MPRKRKPQPRSRGTIVQKGPDSFLLRVYTGTDAEGKRQYASRGHRGDRKGATKALTQFLHDLDTDNHLAASSRTLAKYLEEWLEIRNDISERTKSDYRYQVEQRIVPALGHKRLDALTHHEIQRAVVQWSQEGLAPRSVQYAFVVLRMALRHAVLTGGLLKNPSDNVKLPKKVTKEMKVLTPQQVALFLETMEAKWNAGAVDGKMYPLWSLLLTSGIRPGEARGLKWEDFDGPQVSIRRSVAIIRKDGDLKMKEVVTEPKTASGRRTVVLPGSTMSALEEHRRRQKVSLLKSGGIGSWDGWVFSSRSGGFLPYRRTMKLWKRDLEACGVPEVRLYDTRHTHATVMLAAGVHPKVAQQRLGHSDVSITLNTYTHVLKGMDEQVAEMMEKAFYTPKKLEAV